ncbi:MAG TPA: hypothetical protein VLD38_08785 [Nitrosopumilaceae archaeon]|nr:hypothetical protein [Nitrosopumilaceae archaeon]
MNPKTVMGISFTAVFVLSILSAITAIQADSILKVKHLPDLRTTKSVSTETVKVDTENKNIKLFGSNTDEKFLEPSILNNQLKN